MDRGYIYTHDRMRFFFSVCVCAHAWFAIVFHLAPSDKDIFMMLIGIR